MIDFDRAMLDPASVFDAPGDVVADTDLTQDQKVAVLRQWEYDCHELEVAEEEANMTRDHPEVFDQVVAALRSLGISRDTEHTPPTK